MLPQCDAFGFIFDQSGAPSEGTLVTLKKVVDADGSPILLGPLVTTTDATGAYHFTVPQGSTAYVSARADTLWSCNGGTAMLVPATSSGELIPAFAPPASFGVAPPLQFVSNVLTIPKASATQDGYLSAADWALFNAGGTGVAGVVTFNGRSGVVVPVQTDYAVFTPTVQGMVPAPGTPSTEKYLRDDGLWAIPPGGTDGGTGLLPGEYLVTDFNVSGSPNQYSGSIGAGSTLLTTSSATDFQVGQGITIVGAGTSGALLVTKVTSVSGTSIVLQNAAAASVTATLNNVLHDETVGIQSAIDTVCAAGGGTILFPLGYYRVNKGFSSFNSILKIPTRAYNASPVLLVLKAATPTGYQGYAGPVTDMGSVIIKTQLTGSSSSMISGGAYNNEAGDFTTVNNTNVWLEGLTFRTYDNPQINAIDLQACGNYTVIRDVSVDTGAPLLSAAEPSPGIFGIRLPGNSTSIFIECRNVAVNNYGTGIIASEIAYFQNTVIMQCKVGLQLVTGYHLLTGRFLMWHCPTVINFANTSSIPHVVKFEIDIEQALGPSGGDPAWTVPAPNHTFYDPGDLAVGKIDYIAVQAMTGYYQDVGVTGLSRAAVANLGGATTIGTGAITIPNLRALKLYDGTAMQPLSVGASDSATVGYRQVRVPNAVADTTPPTITAGPNASPTSSGATITWTTDEPSDSQVEYGLTTSYGSSTTLDPTLVTSHAVTLSGLSVSTAYHYRVKCKDAAGNLRTSSDFTFTTTTSGGTALLAKCHSYWKLDEIGGSRADSAGSNTLTVAGSGALDSQAGIIGQAAHFSTGTNWLTCVDSPGLSYAGQPGLAIAFWVKLSAKVADHDFFAKIDGLPNLEYVVGWYSASDRFRYTVRMGGTYSTVFANSLGSPAVGTWYFIVVQYTVATNTISIQVNNGPIDTLVITGSPDTGSMPLVVGTFDTSTNFMNGLIDELGFYDLLNTAEITALWNSGAGLSYPF